MSNLRGIDVDFAEAFKKNVLYGLYKEHKRELILGVRNNYLNLYYNCGSIAKIEYKNKKFTYDISDSYLNKKSEEITPQLICDNYEVIKKNIDKCPGEEGKAQSKLFILNNEEEKKSKWFCIDTENANSDFRGRFDIIAITKTSPHKVALIEIKYGARAFDGKGGIYEHIENFTEFCKIDYFKDQMRQEIINIIKSLKNLDIYIPFDIPDVNSISSKPDFYFITLDNNPDKEGASTPKQKMSARLFDDGRWDCKRLPKENPSVQSKFGDVTDVNNPKFHATFLFSPQTVENIAINDIIEDNSYDKEPK